MKEASQGHGDPAQKFVKTSTEFWMNLQMIYDLRKAEKALLSEREKEHSNQQKRDGRMRTRMIASPNPAA